MEIAIEYSLDTFIPSVHNLNKNYKLKVFNIETFSISVRFELTEKTISIDFSSGFSADGKTIRKITLN